MCDTDVSDASLTPPTCTPTCTDGLLNEKFDDLTMKLLVNKNQYNKWLAKNEPAKYDEREKLFAKMRNRRNDLSGIFGRLLASPREIVATDINETFDVFIGACILHLEREEATMVGRNNDANPMMFGRMDEDGGEGGEGVINNTKNIDDYSFVMRNFHRRHPF